MSNLKIINNPINIKSKCDTTKQINHCIYSYLFYPKYLVNKVVASIGIVIPPAIIQTFIQCNSDFTQIFKDCSVRSIFSLKAWAERSILSFKACSERSSLPFNASSERSIFSLKDFSRLENLSKKHFSKLDILSEKDFSNLDSILSSSLFKSSLVTILSRMACKLLSHILYCSAAIISAPLKISNLFYRFNHACSNKTQNNRNNQNKKSQPIQFIYSFIFYRAIVSPLVTFCKLIPGAAHA